MSGFVPKGSVAVDGISLTVAKLRKRGFAVWIIPHTRKVTNLRTCKRGDPVNLETDLLGKYVLRQLNRWLDRSYLHVFLAVADVVAGIAEEAGGYPGTFRRTVRWRAG